MKGIDTPEFLLVRQTLLNFQGTLKHFDLMAPPARLGAAQRPLSLLRASSDACIAHFFCAMFNNVKQPVYVEAKAISLIALLSFWHFSSLC